METQNEMSTDLLSLFEAAPSTPSKEVIETAKSELTEQPIVELKGVNSPEFEFEPNVVQQTFVEQIAEQIAETVVEIPSEIEMSFDFQHGEKNVIEIQATEDGLGDDELPLTEAHTIELDYSDLVEDEGVQEEQAETFAWYELPLDMEELGLKTRTVNILRNAGIASFSMLKGMHISELKEMKGMGAGSLEDIYNTLEKFGAKDWIDKTRGSTRDSSTSGEMYAEVKAETTVEVNTQRVEAVAEVVEAVGVRTEESASEPIKSEAEKPTSSPAVSEGALKILVLGNASSSSGKGRIVSFEIVYGRQIANICTQNNVPSISLIEYSKGWSTLAANIRQLGWPQGVDVLCISKSFAMRSEVILELRLLADVVVEC
jgi:hypothetical protein